MDVICIRFNFGKVQEEVLGIALERLSQHPKQNVYLFIISLLQKKTSRVIEEMSFLVLH